MTTPDVSRKTDNAQIAAEVVKVPAQQWLSDQYFPYTMYVIRSRALVDVDGLKPVARRALYTMFREGLTPSSKHMKTSRAAGLVTAFHPHGDSSITDAIARMAQDFSLRVPLIDPAGSVGKQTGDVAAAPRYWECRLTRAAMELLKETADGAVKMGKNYDGEMDEPTVLPARWPVNIINGTEGIAVGYASTMFSHNPTEVMKAVRTVLKNPETTVDELLKIMPGPDLPTGGELFGMDGVKEYYETGSGGFKVRARYTVDNLSRGRVRITFYEMPYQVAAEQVEKKIRAMQSSGKLKEISTIKDLSDMKNGLRFVLETKAGSNHIAILNELFKLTPLEVKVHTNSTVLIDGMPVRMSMLGLINSFIEFRRECSAAKLNTRMGKIDSRLYQLDAILAALVDIDKCIAIIRNSDSADTARTELTKAFSITNEQADFILSMQLRRLTKADSIAINKEKEELAAEKQMCLDTINSVDLMNEYIDKELSDTAKIIDSPRRTLISGLSDEELKAETRAMAQAARDESKNLTCFVSRFADGTLMKTLSEFVHTEGSTTLQHAPLVERLKMKTQDSLVVVGSFGNAVRIPLSYLKQDIVGTAEEFGVKFTRGEDMVAIAKTTPGKLESGLILGTRLGEVKMVRPELPNKDEFVIFNLAEGDQIINGRWIGRTMTGSGVLSMTRSGNFLAYDATTIRPTGWNAGGVRSQKVAEGDEVMFFDWVSDIKSKTAFVFTQATKTMKMTPLSDIPLKGKGSQGFVIHKFRVGESTILNAYAGENLIATPEGLKMVITTPSATKRGASGEPFTMKTVVGSLAPLVM